MKKDETLHVPTSPDVHHLTAGHDENPKAQAPVFTHDLTAGHQQAAPAKTSAAPKGKKKSHGRRKK